MAKFYGGPEVVGPCAKQFPSVLLNLHVNA